VPPPLSATATRRRARAAARAFVGGALAVCLFGVLCTPAGAATGVAMSVSFQPDRLGASSALTVALRFAGSAGATPAPLSGADVHLPRGLGIDLRAAAVCAAARVRAGRCPRASLVGRGHAQLEVLAGSQTIPEQAVLSAYRGPARGGRPTLEILGVGSTPLSERTLNIGVLRPDSAPFGSVLAIAVAPIPTVVYEPDGSFDSLTLTIGGRGSAARILVPAHCPAGGFPFALDAAFSDGTSTRAGAGARCP